MAKFVGRFREGIGNDKILECCICHYQDEIPFFIALRILDTTGKMNEVVSCPKCGVVQRIVA